MKAVGSDGVALCLQRFQQPLARLGSRSCSLATSRHSITGSLLRLNEGGEGGGAHGPYPPSSHPHYTQHHHAT